MIVGMIFNLMVAVPLVLMVIQFARTAQAAERHRPVARRPDDVLDLHRRTTRSGLADAREMPAPAPVRVPEPVHPLDDVRRAPRTAPIPPCPPPRSAPRSVSTTTAPVAFPLSR